MVHYFTIMYRPSRFLYQLFIKMQTTEIYDDNMPKFGWNGCTNKES